MVQSEENGLNCGSTPFKSLRMSVMLDHLSKYVRHILYLCWKEARHWKNLNRTVQLCSSSQVTNFYQWSRLQPMVILCTAPYMADLASERIGFDGEVGEGICGRLLMLDRNMLMSVHLWMSMRHEYVSVYTAVMYIVMHSKMKVCTVWFHFSKRDWQPTVWNIAFMKEIISALKLSLPWIWILVDLASLSDPQASVSRLNVNFL